MGKLRCGKFLLNWFSKGGEKKGKKRVLRTYYQAIPWFCGGVFLQGGPLMTPGEGEKKGGRKGAWSTDLQDKVYQCSQLKKKGQLP